MRRRVVRRIDVGQVVRAGSVSLITTATDVACLVLLVELLGLHVTIAAFFAAATGAVTKFVLGKTWAFRDSSGLCMGQIARYLGMVAGSVVLVAGAMHVFATIVGLPYLLAKAASGVLVFFGWSYPVQSRFVFVRSCP